MYKFVNEIQRKEKGEGRKQSNLRDFLIHLS